MQTLTAFADEIVLRLAWSSLQACLLVAAVALLLRLAPRLPAAARSMLWWLVGAQVLLGLAWSHPVALPLLAPPAAEVVAAPRMPMLPSTGTDAAAAMPMPAAPVAEEPSLAGRLAPAWPVFVLLAWLAGLAWQLPRLWCQWRQAGAVHAGARPLEDEALQLRCRRQAQALGLRRCPQLRQCDAIGSPQVGGWLRPVVLLPARQALDAGEWDMAIAHELAHLARRDLWLGLVPALAQRLFFFHPGVRWAMREYALNREAACDARVMRDHHTAVQAYGRLLLRLGVSHPLHAGLAGASPTFDNLRRRLNMLQQSVNESNPRSRGWLLVALVALAGVLPYRVTAGDGMAKIQTAAPAPQPSPAASAAPLAHPTPMTPATPPMPAAPVVPPAPMVGSYPPPPPAPPAPAAPLPPPPPPPAEMGFGGRHSHVTINRSAGEGLALFDGDNTLFNGNDRDMEQARRLRQDGKPMLWFRRGDKAYLVRDPATVAQAQAIYRPVTDLAREQGELAGRQAGLAAREAGYAREQAALAARQAELAGVAAQASAEPDAATQQQRALQQQQARLEAERVAMEKATAAQRQELEVQRTRFEQQRQTLAQRQQQADRQAELQLRQLLDQAIRKGTAQAVDAG
jgi:beta-lactamase regulating signal transducer with metallopeptidase domain